MAKGVDVSELQHLNPLEHLPEDHFLAVIYGVRRSGKTTMLRQLVYDLYPKMQDWQVFVFCSTAQFNTTSYDWVPKKSIISETSEIDKKLDELLTSQREKLERLAKAGKLPKEVKARKGGAHRSKESKPKGAKRHPNHAHEKEKRQKLTEAAKYAIKTAEGDEGGDDEDSVPDILVIMDDVMSEDAIRHARAMGTVAMNGRQYRISCIILSQMVAGSGSIPPRVRTQVVCLCGSDGSTE
tara:strand:+ start:1116 stop:1832 length:717 start_codon:yes stop_codon:yes gene_type:complete